eukprot:433873-Amphidinium_carterae.2
MSERHLETEAIPGIKRRARAREGEPGLSIPCRMPKLRDTYRYNPRRSSMRGASGGDHGRAPQRAELPSCLTHGGTKWTAAVALVSKWHIDHMAYGVRVPESHYSRVQQSFGTDAKQRYTLKGCHRRWDAEDVTSVCRQANWEVQVFHTLGRSGTWLLKSDHEPARWCLTVAAHQERHQLAIARYEAKQLAPTTKAVKPEPGQTWASVLHADLVVGDPSGDAKQATEPQPKQAPHIVEWAEAADSDTDEEDESLQEDEKLSDWEQVGLDMEEWTKQLFQEEFVAKGDATQPGTPGIGRGTEPPQEHETADDPMDQVGAQKKRKGADETDEVEQPAPKKWVQEQLPQATQLEAMQPPESPHAAHEQEALDPMQKLIAELRADNAAQRLLNEKLQAQLQQLTAKLMAFMAPQDPPPRKSSSATDEASFCGAAQS